MSTTNRIPLTAQQREELRLMEIAILEDELRRVSTHIETRFWGESVATREQLKKGWRMSVSRKLVQLKYFGGNQ